MSERKTGRKLIAGMAAGAMVAGALLCSSCTRKPHLRENFGVKTRAAFERQTQAAHSGNGQGLDPEEAGLIHERYREQLGQPTGAQSKERGSQVLIVDQGKKTNYVQPDQE